MSDSVKKYFENLGIDVPKDVKSELPKDKIVEDVIDKFRARSREGILKYNTTLEDSKDGFNAFLNHAMEEAMDWILYLEKLRQITNGKGDR